MEQVCFDLASTSGALIAGGITTVITVASALSNFVGKTTLLGKLINYLAINIKVEKKN